MTNEQREAIEICKEKTIESFYDFPNPTSIELKETDVEYYENIANTAIVQVLQELLGGEK